MKSENITSDLEAWRNELDLSLKDYIKDYYPNGVYTVIGYISINCFSICTSKKLKSIIVFFK